MLGRRREHPAWRRDELATCLAEPRARRGRGDFHDHPPIWLVNEMTLQPAEKAL